MLRCYGESLQAIAYLLPAEMERLVEEEAHAINLSVVANQRNYAQLCMHLLHCE